MYLFVDQLGENVHDKSNQPRTHPQRLNYLRKDIPMKMVFINVSNIRKCADEEIIASFESPWVV